MLCVELSYVSDFDDKFIFYVTMLVEFNSRLHISNQNIVKHLCLQHFTLLHLYLRWLNQEVNELLVILRRRIITTRLLL